MSFSKILIANRGEIACRILRTAKALGFRAVAVHSEADADAPHVRQADEAVAIGPPPARDSYLNITALIAAARATGAQAVHPGYGFLSENAEFAEACDAANLVFIGPPAAAIRAMGNKAAAKRRMIEAGVPCVPGYQGADQSDAALAREAKSIGFPVMVKAAAGGGGRGMRLVAAAQDLAAALATARSEAESAFRSAELILEKAVVDARHVEIQVFADQHGNVVHLGERDCSVQRRHQKVIEEAPSPAVSTELRRQMGDAAVAAARAIGYVGAGTVEFLLAPDGAFYFLEMNTRLQVEHPVTEAITGLDLVAWQLRVAQGERLPLEQHEIRFDGHAIEARLYAEDPTKGFLPQTGRVLAWVPAAGEDVRVDHGVRAGQDVSPWYDPMLAKVIAFGASRDEARRRLVRALEETLVLGLPTNRRFLLDVLAHPEFTAGRATTAFIGTYFPANRLAAAAGDDTLLALAAVLWFEATSTPATPHLRNWRSTGPATWPLRLKLADAERMVRLTAEDADRYRVAIGETGHQLRLAERSAGRVRMVIDGAETTARFAFAGDILYLDRHGTTIAVEETLWRLSGAAEGAADTELRAPMDGKIVAVLGREGEAVAKGQRLVVLEAMKMQHEIVARAPGTIHRLAVREGEQVAIRQLLVELAPLAAE